MSLPLPPSSCFSFSITLPAPPPPPALLLIFLILFKYKQVGRTTLDSREELVLEDFSHVEKMSFPPSGNTKPGFITPPHPLAHTFKFKSYSLQVFRRIRSFFGIDNAEYMMSVCGTYLYQSDPIVFDILLGGSFWKSLIITILSYCSFFINCIYIVLVICAFQLMSGTNSYLVPCLPHISVCFVYRKLQFLRIYIKFKIWPIFFLLTWWEVHDQNTDKRRK